MKSEHNMGPFLRVMNRFGRVTANSISPGELTKGEFFCLGAICNSGKENPEKGGIYVWELAQRTHVHPPAVSRTLRELESKGLIERTVDREDRRNIKVQPTQRGIAAWAKAEEGTQDFVRQVLARMGEEKMEQLVGLCDHLCDIIEEEQAKQSAKQIKENTQC